MFGLLYYHNEYNSEVGMGISNIASFSNADYWISKIDYGPINNLYNNFGVVEGGSQTIFEAPMNLNYYINYLQDHNLFLKSNNLH